MLRVLVSVWLVWCVMIAPVAQLRESINHHSQDHVEQQQHNQDVERQVISHSIPVRGSVPLLIRLHQDRSVRVL